MAEQKLATFRVDALDWQAFQEWAKANGSNASVELNNFILGCIGRTDLRDIPDIDKRIDKRIDSREWDLHSLNETDWELEKKINRLDSDIDKRIEVAIAALRKELGLPTITPEPVAKPETIEPTIGTNDAPLLPFEAAGDVVINDTPEPLEVVETVETAIAPDLSKGLSGKELATRFGCDAGGLSKHGQRDNFAQWSAEKDPHGIAWKREGDGRKCRYFPASVK